MTVVLCAAVACKFNSENCVCTKSILNLPIHYNTGDVTCVEFEREEN